MDVQTGFLTAAGYDDVHAEKSIFLRLLKTRLENQDITYLYAAEALARFVHGHVLRNNGKLYINHPLRVAAKGKTDNEKIARLLHDVPEESLKYSQSKYFASDLYRAPVTFIDLEFLGFDEEVIEKVRAMTKKGPYLNYIMDLSKTNAIKEKLDDLDDNLEDNPNPERVALYLLSRNYLMACLANPALCGSDIRDFAIQNGLYSSEIFNNPKFYAAPQKMDIAPAYV